jgi:hypothetical protein
MRRSYVQAQAPKAFLEHRRRSGKAHAEVAGRFEEAAGRDGDALALEQLLSEQLEVGLARDARKDDRT